MTALADARVLAEHLGLDLRELPKTEPTAAPCRCLSARGTHEPRIFERGRCQKCGHWMRWVIGDLEDRGDIEALAHLVQDVNKIAETLREKSGATSDRQYARWLRGAIARTERELTKLCALDRAQAVGVDHP